MSGIPLALFVAGAAAGHAAMGQWLLCRFHALGLDPKFTGRVAFAPLVVPALLAIWWIWVGLATGWFPAPRGFQADLALAYGIACNVIAWLILPGGAIVRGLRRTPDGVGPRSESTAFTPDARWIGEGTHHWMLRLRGNEALSLRVVGYEVASDRLPEATGDLHILHLSDLHFARCYGRGYFEAVAEAAAGWEADLVLFTGDLLDDDATLDWTGPVLGRLRGRLGQYAILGNHDVIHRPGRVRRALRGAGFAILDGRWATVEDVGRTIALGGTSAPWGPGLDPAGRPEADLTIVLSHSPDEFPRVASWGTVDLVLAGHNHGGQIRLPGFGPVLMPSRYGLRYDRGFFRRGRTLMEVTQGVGGKHPVRYRCPPEVVRIVVRPSRRRPSSAAALPTTESASGT